MVFFECRLGENTANLRESLWFRRTFMPQIESHAQSRDTRVKTSHGLACDPSRAHKGPLRKMGRLFQGVFIFERARRALASETLCTLLMITHPQSRSTTTLNLPRAAAIPPCAG